MENLRWILLGIGALFIVGIYFWDFYNKKKIPKRRSDIIFNEDIDVDSKMSITPEDDEPRDYLDAISGLNKVLDQDEPESQVIQEQMTMDNIIEPHRESETVLEETQAERKIRTVIPRSKPQQTYDLDKDFFGEPIIDDADKQTASISEQSAGLDDTTVQEDKSKQTEAAAIEDEFIIIRIISKDEEGFKGLKLLTSTKHVDMKFGNMNIFHHYGIGDMKANKPLFSLANMYEPGEFNLQEMDSFTTKGVVLYMSLPTVIDSAASFELMLNASQRIADDLDGELKGDRGQAMNDEVINSMREKVRRFS